MDELSDRRQESTQSKEDAAWEAGRRGMKVEEILTTEESHYLHILR